MPRSNLSDNCRQKCSLPQLFRRSTRCQPLLLSARHNGGNVGLILSPQSSSVFIGPFYNDDNTEQFSFDNVDVVNRRSFSLRLQLDERQRLLRPPVLIERRLDVSPQKSHHSCRPSGSDNVGPEAIFFKPVSKYYLIYPVSG